jgi:hypothetical protein
VSPSWAARRLRLQTLLQPRAPHRATGADIALHTRAPISKQPQRDCNSTLPWLISFSLDFMTHWLFAIGMLLNVSSCQSVEQKTTFVADGRTYCAKHYIPLVTVHGFQAPAGMFMHSRHPRYALCEEQFPNHVWATRWLYRSNVRHIPVVFSYCPRCEGEFWKCVGERFASL